MQAPDFWQSQTWRQRLTALALSPLGLCYSGAVALSARCSKPLRCPVPVICVGNLTAGGAGKTPVAMALAQRLMARGRKTFFLTRGYGGALTGPIRVIPEHRAADVGDEPLLLVRHGPTIVARHRAQGAALALALGAQAIVMDDGHQNFALVKDLSLVVVDAATGFGNGRVLPAGPLRECIGQGLRRADAVIFVGEGDVPLYRYSGPVLRARLRPAEVPALRGARVVAFAGIGRPEKFFQSLEACGALVVAAKRFADHHVYTPAEVAYLHAIAKDLNAVLATTGKDYVRLTEVEREGIFMLPVEAVFDDPPALETLLNRVAA